MISIYGTFGPACAEKETLTQMFHAGMTGMRLNLSHTSLAESADRIAAFRAAAEAAGVVPELLIDMQGPELRIGELPAALSLTDGDTVILGEGGIPVPAVTLPVMYIGDEVVLDDGKISVRITEKRGSHVLCRVERGGVLSSRKSIKLKNPKAAVDMPVLTEHDLNNVRRAKEYGVTGLMQPFVRSGAELRKVRRALAENGAHQVKIFAKIENMQGVDNLENILPEADVVIIARGDLGNDMELWQLPAVQKKIAAACVRAGKPFIVVTQMLASMEHSPVPTRAEVSDIFNAVVDGCAGVMVTGETAVGAYPVEAVRYLTNTAKEAEKYLNR
ncbi:MAG: pyruvate kinase [Oscillospiraceae bacterium]|nr:pyruvate kinase [Oscillospiraceae bacterium]